MLHLHRTDADVYSPDGSAIDVALGRTTHLAIGAHQDDLEIMAYHGIAECYGQKDKWFTGVVTTNGSGSPRTGIYEAYTDNEMQAVRQKEQRVAADIGHFSSVLQLLYPSADIKDPSKSDPVDDIYSILSASEPEILYVHNPADKHDTHIGTLGRSLSAIRRLPQNKRPKHVYGCEVWRDLDWLDDAQKVALPVDKFPNVASALVAVFDSQISGGKRYDIATTGRRAAAATFSSSHETDACTAITYAMDLTPLINDDTLSLASFVADKIDTFKSDVSNKLETFI